VQFPQQISNFTWILTFLISRNLMIPCPLPLVYDVASPSSSRNMLSCCQLFIQALHVETWSSKLVKSRAESSRLAAEIIVSQACHMSGPTHEYVRPTDHTMNIQCGPILLFFNVDFFCRFSYTFRTYGSKNLFTVT
jgi:hypothetical protein